MENFTKGLWASFQEELSIIKNGTATKRDCHQESLKLSVRCLHELKQYTYSYNFKNPEEEILFNKKLAPPFNSEYIYYLRCIKIQDKFEGLPIRALKKGITREQKELYRFFDKNAFFHQYIKAGYHYLDYKYFVRDSFQLDIPFSDEYLSIVDNRFVTISSYRLSQVMAYEKVLRFLDTIIPFIGNNALPASPPLTSGFKWTDRKIDLVELAYALAYKGSVNRGNISVKEIAVALGQLFNVRLDNILYQTRQQMLERKAGDYYLESLITALREGPDND